MSLLSIQNVAISFGPDDIMAGISGEVNPGDRIGLVGRNGAGKSSLLRVMAGTARPTNGERHIARAVKCAIVEQISGVGNERTTVRQEILSAISEVLHLENELEAAAAAMTSGEADAADAYAALLERLELEGGFSYQARLSQIMTGLGIADSDRDRPLSQLSGGQRNRVALAKALLAEPDILLMDEPTNHLDLRGLQWLEGFLTRWRGALVVTSHDRYFLDKVATQVWQIENGRLRAYPGNYSKFEELRAAAIVREQKEYEAQREMIAKEEDFIRRYGAGQRAREAKGRATRLARVERKVAPTKSRSASLRLKASRSGDLVIIAEVLSVGYGGHTIVKAGDFEAERGARIALIGPNGAGKSTLLKTISGELDPVDGRSRLGSNVKLVHYWQEAENLNPSTTVLDALLEDAPFSIQEARDHLGAFLFSGYDVDKRVEVLSGGERSRLALAKLVASQANLLLLDEPTNHLDIPSREALEEALESYTGTIVFASHDRRLINRIATRLWLIEDAKLTQFDGTWEEYVRLEAATQPAEAARPRVQVSERPRSNNEDRKRQQAILTLEAEITAQEQLISTIETQIHAASASGDVSTLREVGHRFDQETAALEALMHRWTEMADE